MNTKKLSLSVSQKKFHSLVRVWDGEKRVMNCRNGSYLSIRPNGDKMWYQFGKRYRDDDLPAVIHSTGTKIWYQTEKLLHRDDDLPAIVSSTGTEEWYQYGKRHRNGGPAVTERPAKPGEHQRCPLRSPGKAGCSAGTEEWYQNGRCHRDGGPAITERPAKPGEHQRCPLRSPGSAGYPDGTELWYQNGKIHRDDGPAFISSDGTKEWFQNGRGRRPCRCLPYQLSKARFRYQEVA